MKWIKKKSTMTDGNHSKPMKLSSGEERVLYASSDKAAPRVRPPPSPSLVIPFSSIQKNTKLMFEKQIFLSHHRDSSPGQSLSKEAAKLAELEMGNLETSSLAGWFGNMTLNPKPGTNTK